MAVRIYSNPQAQSGALRQYYIARYFSLNFHSLQADIFQNESFHVSYES